MKGSVVVESNIWDFKNRRFLKLDLGTKKGVVIGLPPWYSIVLCHPSVGG